MSTQVFSQITREASLGILGEPTQYSAGAASVTVRGIFHAAYLRIEAGMPGVQSFGPAVFYALAALPSDPREVPPEIVIRGVTYSVAEVKPDGQGYLLLHLHRG